MKAWRRTRGLCPRGWCVGIPREEFTFFFIDQDVGGALSGEPFGGDGEHTGPTTGTVGGEQDVIVAARRDRKGAE